jgi:hypothetical protein
VQRPTKRIANANPRLPLPAPSRAYHLLITSVLHLDGGAIHRCRTHVAEDWAAHERAIHPIMPDRIIDAAMAGALQWDAAQTHVLFAWIILYDPPEHPGKFVARLATSHPIIYVMQADTLGELQAMRPPGLTRSDRQPGDPPVVVEIWFSAPA